MTAEFVECRQNGFMQNSFKDLFYSGDVGMFIGWQREDIENIQAEKINVVISDSDTVENDKVCKSVWTRGWIGILLLLLLAMVEEIIKANAENDALDNKEAAGFISEYFGVCQ